MKPRLIPYKLKDFKFIKSKGIKAWLTWATCDQGMGIDNLLWWQKLSRLFFK